MSRLDGSQKKERPSTYVVQDRSNEEELLRLTLQDRMATTAMGIPCLSKPIQSPFVACWMSPVVPAAGSSQLLRRIPGCR